jgi:cytochrome c-type biogenesis protein CcmH/NrfG
MMEFYDAGSIIFGIAGVFRLIMGWIIEPAGARCRCKRGRRATGAGDSNTQPAPPARSAACWCARAAGRPSRRRGRAELGNLYFDGQRFDLAIPWYEASYKIDPKNINVSTDLAVCYHYTEQPDKALAQIDRSLALDAKHPTTLLNQGIIRAFGKQDFTGAVEAWDKVIAIAPNSQEAAKARTLKAAHSSSTTTGPGAAAGPGRGGRGGS